MILTSEQLAVIRAALQFWAEEVCPHGFDAALPYFDEVVDSTVVSTDEVTQLRRRLQCCELQYAALLPSGQLSKPSSQVPPEAWMANIVTILR